MSSESKDTDSTLCESGNHDVSKNICLVGASPLTPPSPEPIKTQEPIKTPAASPAPTHQDDESDPEIEQPALFEKPLPSILLSTISEGEDRGAQVMVIPPEAEQVERLSIPQPDRLRPAARSSHMSPHENDQSAEPRRGYPQVHAREFSRLSVSESPDSGGYFMSRPAFPPPDMSEANRKLEEYLYYKFPAPELAGIESRQIENLLTVYTKNCQKYCKTVQEEKECQKAQLMAISDKAQEIRTIEKESLFLDMAIKKRKARAVAIHEGKNLKWERKRRLLAEEANAIHRYQHRLEGFPDRKRLLGEEIDVANGEIRKSKVKERKYYEQVYLEEYDPATKAELDAASERKREIEKEERSDLVEMASTFGIQPKPQGPFSTKRDQPASHPSSKLPGQSPKDIVESPSLSNQSQSSEPDSDLVGFVVPSWFRIFLSNSSMTFSAQSDKGKFDQLISHLAFLTEAINRGDATPSAKAPFIKNWHEPNNNWPFPGWQERGGWWTCRMGPGASPAEQACKLCRSKRSIVGDEPGETLAEQHKKLMADINKAMELAVKPEKEALKARIQAERDEADRRPARWYRVIPLIGESIANYWARK
ncbi:hypothetical protein B0T19DRAFT_227152 [Cercophora scortea]|uniref:Uncharacterized protein n=1 Tax=Cercophora scortea TaxID=314031 RepID=A0AAE0IH81_9PEZI|nr:hypothetical protein B0T19DRAFT_227152 [Cercophora scortea]